ncbi:hypothetical protein KAH37_04540 [bacterium]|nr:hypothetical protein [bacterium]
MSLEDLTTFSDVEIIAKIISGDITRNKHYEFFNTSRGRRLQSKSKSIKALVEELASGATVVSEKKQEGRMAIKIKNDDKNYVKTVFFDQESWEIYSKTRKKGVKNGKK